ARSRSPPRPAPRWSTCRWSFSSRSSRPASSAVPGMHCACGSSSKLADPPGVPVMQTIPDTLCYLNGEYSSLRDAKVSVLDRGFIFGDGIYEVVPAYGGKLFRFDEHLARLNRSLTKLRMENPHTREQWI